MENKTAFYESLIERGKVRGVPRLSLEDCRILDATARGIQARTMLEIGSAAGTSTMLLGRVAQEHGGVLLALEPAPDKAWRPNVEALGLAGTVRHIQGYSPWVRELLDPSLVLDYLFIDGEHKTRWALVDYHCWSPKVRVGGRIAFHDIYGVCGPKVERALALILEDDAARLVEIARGAPARDRGVVVFEKAR